MNARDSLDVDGGFELELAHLLLSAEIAPSRADLRPR